MWGKIIIPMYRLWLSGLYGPRCPLSPKRPINLISLSLQVNHKDNIHIQYYWALWGESIQWLLMDSPHKGSVIWKAFPCYAVNMSHTTGTVVLSTLQVPVSSQFNTLRHEQNGWHYNIFKRIVLNEIIVFWLNFTWVCSWDSHWR